MSTTPSDKSSTLSDPGPQNPSLESNARAARGGGIAYEVFSVDDQGRRKRHQMWKDKAKAYNQMKDLKRLYGHEIRVGIREVSDMKGNLYTQVIRKCRALLKAGAPAAPGIVTAAGKVRVGKSPKVSGHVVGKLAIGQTKSGKVIHNDPEHESHQHFSAADHMDAYRAHAKQLSKLDPGDTHPSIITHHKNALNAHYRLGTSVRKGLRASMALCEELLSKSSAWSDMDVGRTPSGKHVHGHATHAEHAGFTAGDHHAASRLHMNLARNAERAARQAQVAGNRKDAETYVKKFRHHDRQAAAHRNLAEAVGRRAKGHVYARVNAMSDAHRPALRPTN